MNETYQVEWNKHLEQSQDNYINRRYKIYQLSLKTLTPWITTPCLNSTPKAFQVKDGYIFVSISFRSPPLIFIERWNQHLHGWIMTCCTWNRPWEVTRKLLSKEKVSGGSPWSADQWGQPTSGPIPGYHLHPVIFHGAFYCIATCLVLCYVGLMLWWALQSMWCLRGDVIGQRFCSLDQRVWLPSIFSQKHKILQGHVEFGDLLAIWV